jgi:hypothetical protein
MTRLALPSPDAIQHRRGASPAGTTAADRATALARSTRSALAVLAVCAMGVIERGFSAERVFPGVFDYWSGLETDRS